MVGLKDDSEKRLSELQRAREDEFEKIHYYFEELRKELEARELILREEYNSLVQDAEHNL